ncbi:2'-5' RNA ligase family protein [Glycomyces sp. L485]|uniref:2'-5' RNA ligase family protein n=1 Tax=Glycomyces sp. L485 TaxID=2909235 RepID=UPI001F4ACD07|nr:2'-5' RNA ligase family protein [Glycomyces sp. L485]MCH7231595.1 2'-5' RNA ligase family protein [Glycomyces sp. L485]
MSKYKIGQTALVAVVDDVELLVDRWRQRFNSSAAAGMPAHVTVLVPFLDLDRIDEVVLDELTALFARQNRFSVEFDRIGRFPDVRYLVPTPDHRFRELTEVVSARWPEAPPYGGQFAEVTPHLTVANGQQPEIFDEVEAAMETQLPVSAVVSSISLFVSDGSRWHRRTEFPLASKLRKGQRKRTSDSETVLSARDP